MRLLHLEVFLIVLLIILLDVVVKRRAVLSANAAGFWRRRALRLRKVFALLVGDAPDRVQAVVLAYECGLAGVIREDDANISA